MSIRIRFITTRHNENWPPSYWAPALFAWHGLQTYRPLSDRAKGLREGFIMSKKLNSGLPKKAKAVTGKSDTLWSVSPGIYHDLGLALRKPTLGHLFWHSDIVMTILCHSLSSQTGHCETRYFSSTLWSQYLYAASGQLKFRFARHCCILGSLFPVPDCPYLIPLGFGIAIHCNLICHYHAIPLPSVFSRLNT